MRPIAARYRWARTVAALLAAALAGCASVTGPLGTRQLREDAKDPRVGVVVLRFKTEGMPPAGTAFHDQLTKSSFLGGIPPPLHWQFAVANEATGWTIRVLEEAGQILRTRGDSIEPGAQSEETGWVSFLAPPGTTYVVVMPGSTLVGLKTVARLPDRISVQSSATPRARGFVEEPRIAVQVREPREIVYAGTIVATLNCHEEKLYHCPYELTPADETGLARSFVSRHLGHLAPASPMQTRLFTIPQSRTVTVRDPPEGR